MTQRAALYSRISQDREGRELGVQRQQEDLESLAQRHRLDVVARYTDNDRGASTRSRKSRPEYAQMIADAKAGKFEVILAYTSSRLTRRPMEWEDLIQLWERHGIRYQFVASPAYDLDTADGRMTARIAASIDAAEAERTAERGARARRQAREQGKHGGGFHPWWTEPVDGTLRLIPERVVLLREAVKRITRGASQAEVCRDWNTRDDVPQPRRAKVWQQSNFRHLLTNRALIGQTVGPDGALVRDAEGQVIRRCEPILSLDEWHALQAALAKPPGRGNGNGRRYLLSGLVTCLCGAPRHYCPQSVPRNRSQHRKHRLADPMAPCDCIKSHWLYLLCRSSIDRHFRGSGCAARSVRADKLHHYVERAFLDLFGTQPVLRRVHRAAHDPSTELAQVRESLEWFYCRIASAGPGAASAIQPQIDQLEARLEALIAATPTEASVHWESTGQTYADAWHQANDDTARRQILLDGGFEVVCAPGDDAERAEIAGRLAVQFEAGRIGQMYRDAPFALAITCPQTPPEILLPTRE
jgi:DNA invertase Pin-like site-specific DNA recombinase